MTATATQPAIKYECPQCKLNGGKPWLVLVTIEGLLCAGGHLTPWPIEERSRLKRIELERRTAAAR